MKPFPTQSHALSRLLALVLLGLESLLPKAHGGNIVADSGSNRVSLVELYSSEGCSSCPPAEKWLGSLAGDDRLWKDFVPVAFHVDYWDNLGWKDVFASPANTDRQRAYADEWNASNVYTPCTVLNGKEWKGANTHRLKAAKSQAMPGQLKVEQTGADEFIVTFIPSGEFEGGSVWISRLGFDQVSDVRSGENSGRKLSQNFVALGLVQAVLIAPAHDGKWTATVTIPGKRTARSAIAAWVTSGTGLSPLQAAGGWLNPSES